jgi:hypothetical protein
MLKMKRRRSIPPRRCAGTICGGWSIPGNGRGCLAVRWRWVGWRRGCALPPRRKEPSALAQEMRAGLAAFPGPVTILLAEGDRTAQLFRGHWGSDPRVIGHQGNSHSFADAPEWLLRQVMQAIRPG